MSLDISPHVYQAVKAGEPVTILGRRYIPDTEDATASTPNGQTDVTGKHGYRRTPRVPPKISWEDPPRDERSSGEIDWGFVASTLRGSPGRWAKIVLPTGFKLLSGTYQQIASKRQVLGPFRPAGSFESVIRGGDLYARYVGTEDSARTKAAT